MITAVHYNPIPLQMHLPGLLRYSIKTDVLLPATVGTLRSRGKVKHPKCNWVKGLFEFLFPIWCRFAAHFIAAVMLEDFFKKSLLGISS